jgi:hypothetical protein
MCQSYRADPQSPSVLPYGQMGLMFPRGRPPMWIDEEEFWPRRSSVVGLEFATDEEYERCSEWVLEDPDRYFELYPEHRMVVIRKTDIPLVSAAGFQYVERRFRDLDSLPLDQQMELHREAVKAGMAVLLARYRAERAER